MAAGKRQSGYPSARNLAAMVAPVALAPAILFNVDWTAGPMSPLSLANAASIIFSAVFVAAAFRAKSRALAVAFGLTAGLLIFVNITTAFGVASSVSSGARDHRATIIATIQRLKSQWSRLSDGRKSAAMVAGEMPTAAIAAELEQAIAAGARRWSSTNQCAPQATTATASIRLCATVAALRGRLAAATRRDALDAQLDRLSREIARQPAPENADPYVAGVVSLFAMMDSPLSPGLAKALPALRDWFKAVGLELIAAFGPLAWVTLWTGHRERPVPVPVAKPLKTATRREGTKPEASKPAEPFATFVTARLEKDAGGVVKAGDAFKAYQQHCAELGIIIDANQQRAFGLRLGQVFRRDKNNGRPVYRGVRLRLELPDRVLAFPARTVRA